MNLEKVFDSTPSFHKPWQACIGFPSCRRAPSSFCAQCTGLYGVFFSQPSAVWTPPKLFASLLQFSLGVRSLSRLVLLSLQPSTAFIASPLPLKACQGQQRPSHTGADIQNGRFKVRRRARALRSLFALHRTAHKGERWHTNAGCFPTASKSCHSGLSNSPKLGREFPIPWNM